MKMILPFIKLISTRKVFAFSLVLKLKEFGTRQWSIERRTRNLKVPSPSYISNLLSFCSSSYSLRSCSNKLLQVPRSKLKSYGDRRFSIAGPKLWNSIPASSRNTDSLDSFKKHLKTFFFFHQAFS